MEETAKIWKFGRSWFVGSRVLRLPHGRRQQREEEGAAEVIAGLKRLQQTAQRATAEQGRAAEVPR